MTDRHMFPTNAEGLRFTKCEVLVISKATAAKIIQDLVEDMAGTAISRLVLRESGTERTIILKIEEP